MGHSSETNGNIGSTHVKQCTGCVGNNDGGEASELEGTFKDICVGDRETEFGRVTHSKPATYHSATFHINSNVFLLF